MLTRASWTLFLVVVLTSCERGRVIGSKPFELGKMPVSIVMDGQRSSGPTRELCLSMPKQDADSIQTAFDRTRRRLSPVHVVLFRVNGIPDTLDAQLHRRGPMTLCLWDHGLGTPTAPHSIHAGATATAEELQVRTAEYTAVELSSDRPIQVSEVRWWTGQRTGVP